MHDRAYRYSLARIYSKQRIMSCRYIYFNNSSGAQKSSAKIEPRDEFPICQKLFDSLNLFQFLKKLFKQCIDTELLPHANMKNFFKAPQLRDIRIRPWDWYPHMLLFAVLSIWFHHSKLELWKNWITKHLDP